MANVTKFKRFPLTPLATRAGQPMTPIIQNPRGWWRTTVSDDQPCMRKHAFARRTSGAIPDRNCFPERWRFFWLGSLALRPGLPSAKDAPSFVAKVFYDTLLGKE
ncbi:hypothetical protein CDAR_98031 [Caerostris darwini]|uniref:Uncharacterized protein n=1 Tax=Caerostris darwini TaxID=1538125 RepID=A0AAV4SQP5_9ARAC|nr:hypothetical protein CDAR_98031 [Caerostris darwini]